MIKLCSYFDFVTTSTDLLCVLNVVSLFLEVFMFFKELGSTDILKPDIKLHAQKAELYNMLKQQSCASCLCMAIACMCVRVCKDQGVTHSKKLCTNLKCLDFLLTSS